MSRRTRAAVLGIAAVACALIAVSLAGDYRDGVEAQLGELRPVVVATAAIAPGDVLDPSIARRVMSVRQVPRRFVPPGALRAPADGLGLEARAPIPAGAYVLAAQLAPPAPERPRRSGVGRGLRAVEIEVRGAAALELAGPAAGSRVDVVVAEEPGPGGRGRTRLAAAAVRLLGLRRPEGPEAAGAWGATLALTRDQALSLIAAQNYAREIRLLPAG